MSVGGLIFSQLMTLYLTPVIYTYIEEMHDTFRFHPAPTDSPHKE